jgi:hypothetical protein
MRAHQFCAPIVSVARASGLQRAHPCLASGLQRTPELPIARVGLALFGLLQVWPVVIRVLRFRLCCD